MLKAGVLHRGFTVRTYIVSEYKTGVVTIDRTQARQQEQEHSKSKSTAREKNHFLHFTSVYVFEITIRHRIQAVQRRFNPNCRLYSYQSKKVNVDRLFMKGNSNYTRLIDMEPVGTLSRLLAGSRTNFGGWWIDYSQKKERKKERKTHHIHVFYIVSTPFFSAQLGVAYR